jgi:hypothetical protein
MITISVKPGLLSTSILLMTQRNMLISLPVFKASGRFTEHHWESVLEFRCRCVSIIRWLPYTHTYLEDKDQKLKGWGCCSEVKWHKPSLISSTTKNQKLIKCTFCLISLIWSLGFKTWTKIPPRVWQGSLGEGLLLIPPCDTARAA